MKITGQFNFKTENINNMLFKQNNILSASAFEKYHYITITTLQNNHLHYITNITEFSTLRILALCFPSAIFDLANLRICFFVYQRLSSN